VTAETADQASPGEASFQLLAEHLPDLVIFAFGADLRMWAATGGAIRARGWTSEEFIGGCGFDPDHVQVIADIAHFGLIAMRERVEALGGRFRVTTAPGQGTVVEARLPPTVASEGPGA